MDRFDGEEVMLKSSAAPVIGVPFVSVIVPIRNEARYIRGCLDSIAQQDYPHERMEIIIADGLSNDGTKESVQSYERMDIPVHWVDNPKLIVPTGMNLALQQARGDILVRVDGHCEIAPDYISNCVKHLQNSDADGVGGSMDTIGETPLSETIAVAMSSPFGVGGSAFRTLRGVSMYADTVPFPAYSREIVERAGLYDEELVRNQDDEYNYRIRELGGKILLASDVKSKYYSRGSLKKLWKQYFQYGFWKVRVLQKHPRQMSLRQFVPLVFVVVLILAALLAIFTGWGRLLLAFVACSYLIANMAASILTASQRGWRHLPLMPLCFAILHVSYGVGFLTGLFRFIDRWDDKERNISTSMTSE